MASVKIKSPSASGNKNTPADTIEVIAPPAPPARRINKITVPHTTDKNLEETDDTKIKGNNMTFLRSQEELRDPLIFVNGERYYLKERRKIGQKIIYNSSDSVCYYAPGTSYAKKWGEKGKNGVVMMYGKNPSVVVQ